MLDFKDAKIEVNKEYILSKISEHDIFSRYCSNFKDIGESFCSELRKDNSPGCNIYINDLNSFRYKDFATGDNFSCFDYVAKKFNCTYSEALFIIAADFGLNTNKPDINPALLLGNEPKPIKKTNNKQKSYIEIVSQNWTLQDYDYWNQYCIPLSLLEEYDIFSAKFVYLFKGDKRYLFEYRKNNPIYAYRYKADNKIVYKIYRPKEEKAKKWLFTGLSSCIDGLIQLPDKGGVLIITKALKDVLCYKLLSYSAISLQGEHNRLDGEFLTDLYKRFKKIIVQYDNDVSGKEAANSLLIRHKLPIFIIPESTGCKDLSDYIAKEGLNRAKKLIDDIIKEI